MKKWIYISLLLIVPGFVIAQPIPKWKITDVEQYIRDSKDDVLVINFWATFCKPCVAEIPFFISTVEKYKSSKVSLLLVSLDLPSFYPKKIASFAKKNGFKTAIAWLDETNADYFCPKVDNAWSGSIPATLVINKKTGFRKFAEEEMSLASFEAIIKQAISN